MPRARQPAPTRPASVADAADAVPSPPLPADVEDYLRHQRVERRAAARTLTLYTEALRKLVRDAQDAGIDLRAVQVHHVRRWTAAHHGRGLSPRSLALMLSAWRGFYRHLGRQGRVEINPVEGVRAPKAARPLPKALSVDDSVQLADHRQPEGDPALETRDRCIVELLYGCGLRVSELVGLDLRPGPQAAGWIDRDAAEAHVLGKGRKRRSVPVGRAALEALDAWLDHRPALLAAGAPDEPALLLNRRGGRLGDAQVRQRLRQRALAAGLATHVHPHMLRHAFASHLLQSSGDLRGVQELLGHAHITTTQVYTRLDFQHLAQAYDAAHPRARKR